MKTKKEIERDLNNILQLLEDPDYTREKYNLRRTDNYDDFPWFMIGYIKSEIKFMLDKEDKK